MRALLFGALLGLLVVFPTLAAAVLGVVAAAVSEPLLVAFGLGLVAGVRVRRSGGWTR